jgi:hypothetical protein
MEDRRGKRRGRKSEELEVEEEGNRGREMRGEEGGTRQRRKS